MLGMSAGPAVRATERDNLFATFCPSIRERRDNLFLGLTLLYVVENPFFSRISLGYDSRSSGGVTVYS